MGYPLLISKPLSDGMFFLLAHGKKIYEWMSTENDATSSEEALLLRNVWPVFVLFTSDQDLHYGRLRRMVVRKGQLRHDQLTTYERKECAKVDKVPRKGCSLCN